MQHTDLRAKPTMCFLCRSHPKPPPTHPTCRGLVLHKGVAGRCKRHPQQLQHIVAQAHAVARGRGGGGGRHRCCCRRCRLSLASALVVQDAGHKAREGADEGPEKLVGLRTRQPLATLGPGGCSSSTRRGRRRVVGIGNSGGWWGSWMGVGYAPISTAKCSLLHTDSRHTRSSNTHQPPI